MSNSSPKSLWFTMLHPMMFRQIAWCIRVRRVCAACWAPRRPQTSRRPSAWWWSYVCEVWELWQVGLGTMISWCLPAGNLTVCYWKWPFIVDFWLCQNSYWSHGHRNSGFTHWKWWFSIAFCMFTRGYMSVSPLIYSICLYHSISIQVWQETSIKHLESSRLQTSHTGNLFCWLCHLRSKGWPIQRPELWNPLGVPAAARAFHQVLGLVWSRHGPIKAGLSSLGEDHPSSCHGDHADRWFTKNSRSVCTHEILPKTSTFFPRKSSKMFPKMVP